MSPAHEVADVTTESRVSLSVLISAGGLATVIFGAALWVVTTMNSVGRQIDAVGVKMSNLEETMNRRTADRWTASHQRIWSDRLGSANPTLRVPSSSDVSRDFGTP